MSRWCSLIQEGLWLTAAVAVPLAFNPWGNNVFELPKTVLLRALVLLILLARLIQGSEARRESILPLARTPIPFVVWPVLALALALTLATVLSVAPRASLWGSYERQQGLLAWGAYLILLLLVGTGIHVRAQVERLWLALVWSSSLVVGYGFLQAAGLDPLDWRSDAVSAILSTIGRPNFVASNLVLVVPLTLGRVLLSDRRWPYRLLLMGQLVCIALTQARGAWVGAAAAVIGFGLIRAMVTRRRGLAAATVAMAALAIAFVVGLNLPNGPLAPLARLPILARLLPTRRLDRWG